MLSRIDFSKKKKRKRRPSSYARRITPSQYALRQLPSKYLQPRLMHSQLPRSQGEPKRALSRNPTRFRYPRSSRAKIQRRQINFYSSTGRSRDVANGGCTQSNTFLSRNGFLLGDLLGGEDRLIDSRVIYFYPSRTRECEERGAE